MCVGGGGGGEYAGGLLTAVHGVHKLILQCSSTDLLHISYAQCTFIVIA